MLCFLGGCFFSFFKIASPYVAQAGLDLVITLLIQPLESWEAEIDKLVSLWPALIFVVRVVLGHAFFFFFFYWRP